MRSVGRILHDARVDCQNYEVRSKNHIIFLKGSATSKTSKQDESRSPRSYGSLPKIEIDLGNQRGAVIQRTVALSSCHCANKGNGKISSNQVTRE